MRWKNRKNSDSSHVLFVPPAEGGRMEITMKNTRRCPKCSSQNIVRVPDDAHRYLANSIAITKIAWVKRIPVVRYVCCDCGYVENWVETQGELNNLKHTFG